MYRKFIKPLGLFVVLALAGMYTACQQEDSVATVDNFTLQATAAIETGCGAGMAGCYELVFPVTLQFSDSTTVEVADFKAMKQAIHDWYVANGGRPTPDNRPTLVFPIQLINQAGEIITVETPEALQELVALCRPVLGGPHGGGPGGPHGGGPHGGGHNGGGLGPCFTLVFPVTVSFPDSTVVTVTTPEELRQVTMDWNKNNPGQHAHPEFVFPLTVTLRDGTQVVVNTKEELQAIKEDCRG